MKGSYVTLGAWLREVKKLEGVIFYSYEMLFDNISFCKDILLKKIKNKKSVHFALEEIHIKNNADIKNLLKIIQIKKNSMPLVEKNILKKILNTKDKIIKQ